MSIYELVLLCSCVCLQSTYKLRCSQYHTGIGSIYIRIGLEVLQEELDSCLECTLLSGFDLGLGQVPANSETMDTACKVLPLIQFRGLGTSAEEIVRLFLSLGREHLVCFTRVDQERDTRLLESLFKTNTMSIRLHVVRSIQNNQPRDPWGLREERGVRRRRL